MKLIGRNMSPFVRRVAISLRELGQEFEQEWLSTADHKDEIRNYNPLGRVPALVLDNGTRLIDSGAILSAIDMTVPEERRLVPADIAGHIAVNQLCAIAIGAVEKAVLSFYERTRRPEELRWAQAIEDYDRQTADGLTVLNSIAQDTADTTGHFHGERLTQADITVAVVFAFVGRVNPELLERHKFSSLQAHSDRCGQIESFLQSGIDQAH
ncbi:glutathione S-transferase family protein [Fodinicurvata sp. EGI_FJ10296]|uniref:glutathione S-transferase family protein n=1 Tax=Fodinicurvata sp. EGI_FJ10296 TaxID=3231908 RepID=UPI0034540867